MKKVQNNPIIRIGLSQPTGNFWVDTGLVVLAMELGEGEHKAGDVLNWLLSKLVVKTGGKGQYYDEAIKQLREYDKESWAYPANLFIRVAGKSGKKVKVGGKLYPTQPPKFELNLELSKKTATCDLCGDEARLTDAKMWMFPFVVDPTKFGNFYSGVRRGLRLCPRCALAGLAGYLGWLWKVQVQDALRSQPRHKRRSGKIWKVQGQDALHFFIFHSSDLHEIKRLHREVLRPLRMGGGKSGNAPLAFAGPYTHETTLGLLLGLFAYIREPDETSENEVKLSDEGRMYLATLFGVVETGSLPPPIALYTVTGKPEQSFNMKAFIEFTKFQSLYRLYERWVKVIAQNKIDHNPHQRIVQIFRQFEIQQKDKRESIWRDKICREILEFGDLFPFVEQFLFEVRAKEKEPKPLVRGSLDILDTYLWEVLGMDEQLQRTLAGFGHGLGEAAHQHNEMGLLYALRNAKNPEDFYRVLNDAQFRLGVTIPEALLKIEKGERIAGVPWVRIKTLLSIYAMNAYLRKSAPQTGEPQTQKEG